MHSTPSSTRLTWIPRFWGVTKPTRYSGLLSMYILPKTEVNVPGRSPVGPPRLSCHSIMRLSVLSRLRIRYAVCPSRGRV